MPTPKSQAVLDLNGQNLPKIAQFAASLSDLTFAQLVVLVGKLDRTRENAARARASAAEVAGLTPDFIAGLDQTETVVTAMFQLVEAELEQRVPF